MTLENLSQSELRAKVPEKVTELHELISQIDEKTQFGAYGTVLYGVEEGDDVLAGGTQYGSAIDIARVLANSEELSGIQMAIMGMSLGFTEEDDE